MAIVLSLYACADSDGVQARARVPEEVTSICGRCHLAPAPEILPKERWRTMVERMGELTERYRLEGDVPGPREVERIVRYYEKGAPAALAVRDPPQEDSPVAFQPHVLGLPLAAADPGGRPPLITHVEMIDLDGDGLREVLVSDARADELRLIHRAGPGTWTESTLAAVRAPSRMEVLDADGDGLPDIAVGSLGKLEPTEELVGSVVLLRNKRDRFEPRVLASGLARVSDVRASDLDGDGDPDLLVAAFGAYKTGQILWLEQIPGGNWKQHVLLSRNGVSHVPVGDLDGDGRPDFVALVSQEHEEIVLHRNAGGGKFEAHLIYRAPHPMFGLSGIELADLDGDGDLDIVFTNGDALDQDPTPKPWHGVRLLENLGRMRFAPRELALFPGAYAVRAGDLDGDGDLDLVVTSMLNEWSDPSRLSILWLENRGELRFVAHPIDTSPTFLATAAVGDLDGDGRQDVIAGGLYVLPTQMRCGRVTLWRNKGSPR